MKTFPYGLQSGFVTLMALACSILMTSPATAQDLPSAEQVIKRHIKSLGGEEKLSSIRSMVTQGVITMPTPQGEMDVDFELIQQGKKFLFAMEIPNVGEMRQGSDGEHYWVATMMGAKLLEGPEVAQAREQYGRLFPSLEWLDYDGEITNEGIEEVEGHKCYKLAFKSRDGASATRFFDAESSMIRRMTVTQQTPQGEITIDSYPTNFKIIDGIRIPFQQTMTTPQGEMLLTIDKIKFNKEIDDTTFDLPDSIRNQIDDN